MKRILKSKKLRKKKKEYLVNWGGHHEKESTWILAKDMENAKDIIENVEWNRGSNKRQC
jgi:hypothetical protein